MKNFLWILSSFCIVVLVPYYTGIWAFDIKPFSFSQFGFIKLPVIWILGLLVNIVFLSLLILISSMRIKIKK